MSDMTQDWREEFDKAMCKYLDYLALKDATFRNRPDVATFPEFHSVAEPFSKLLTQVEQKAREEEAAKYKPLANVVRQMYRDMTDYEEVLLFDIVSMAFERDTGIWPPGKSAPLETYHEFTQKERSEKFSEWVKNLHLLANINPNKHA